MEHPHCCVDEGLYGVERERGRILKVYTSDVMPFGNVQFGSITIVTHVSLLLVFLI